MDQRRPSPLALRLSVVALVSLGLLWLMVHQVREYLAYQHVFPFSLAIPLLFYGGGGWWILILLLIGWRAPKSEAARAFILLSVVSITGMLTTLSPSGIPPLGQRLVWAATASCSGFLLVWFATLFPEPLTLQDMARLKYRGGKWLGPFRAIPRRLASLAVRRKWLLFVGSISALVFVSNFALGSAEYERSGTVGIALGPMPEANGRVVTYVAAGGPAHVSGLRVGDVIQAVNGHELVNPLEGEVEDNLLSPSQRLITLLRSMQPGDTARFEYQRQGSPAVASAELVSWTQPVHHLVWYRGRWFAPVWPLVTVALVSGAVGLTLLWSSYRLADLAGQRRMLWLFLGFLVSSCATVAALTVSMAGIVYDLPWASGLGVGLDVLSGVAFLGGVSIALLAKGALDAKPLITKTTIYGMLGVSAFVLYVAVESVLSELLEARMGLPGMGGAVLAGLLVGALAFPLRRILSKQVAQWFDSTEPGEAVQSTHTS